MRDTTELDREMASALVEIQTVKELMRKEIHENAHTTQNQDEYEKRFRGYEERFDMLKARYDALQDEKKLKELEHKRFSHFNRILRKQETLLTEFDDNLWRISVDTVTCYPDGRMVFRFVGGEEVSV